MPTMDDACTREQRALIIAKIAGRRVVASISGGKDSAAMALFLRELEIEADLVFCDTGWEHDKTYEYLRGELTNHLGPIAEIRGDLLMPDLVRKKGMFPSRTRRFCTEQLKVFPLQRYIKAKQDEIGDVVNAVGIRAAESRARSKMPEWEWNDGFDCEVWRPLIRWTEQDVIEIHRRHGLRPNPLYLEGARRVGCWPCIFAAKAEIRHIATVDPQRIDQIRELEAEVQASAKARYDAKGESFESLGFNRPTFFQAMGSLRTEGGKEGRCVPIDDVIAWSKTSHGGKQVELFQAGDTEAGCMRWGLCETNPPDEPEPEAPMKRYFRIDFDCIRFSIVARDREHVVELLKEHYRTMDDNYEEQRAANGDPDIVELTTEQAASHKLWDDARDGGLYPMTTFELGAVASSEY